MVKKSATGQSYIFFSTVLRLLGGFRVLNLLYVQIHICVLILKLWGEIKPATTKKGLLTSLVFLVCTHNAFNDRQTSAAVKKGKLYRFIVCQFLNFKFVEKIMIRRCFIDKPQLRSSTGTKSPYTIFSISLKFTELIKKNKLNKFCFYFMHQFSGICNNVAVKSLDYIYTLFNNTANLCQFIMFFDNLQ